MSLDFSWQCMRKESVSLRPSATIGDLRQEVARTLTDDYNLETDCDVELRLDGRELTDDRSQLHSAGVTKGCVVSALSVAVAEALGERKKITSMKGVFEHLKETGETGAEAEEVALKNSEPFNLCCPSLELGELGAGWPILFQFMCFLVLLMLVLFLVQIPAMIFFAVDPRIDEWAAPPSNETLNPWLLTAGNLGPEGSNSDLFGFTSLISGIVLLLGSSMMSRKIGVTKRAVDQTEVDATDFGLFVENLPPDVVDEKTVKDWMVDNLRNAEPTEVVKVVIGYNMAEFGRLRKELVDLKSQIAACQDPRTKSTMESKYKDLNATLTNEDSLAKAVGGSGSAVVTLRYQTDHREVLDEWSTCRESVARWCSCFGGIPELSAKPKFDAGGEATMLTITRADNPSDILWENLNVSWEEACGARSKVWGLLFGVFLVAFLIIVGARIVQRRFREDSFFFVMAAGLAIGFSTVAVFMFSKKYIDQERYATKTRKDVSLMVKFTIMYFANYNVALFLASLVDDSFWYGAKGLLSTILLLQIITVVMYPIFYATNCKTCFTGCIRKCTEGATGPPDTQTKLNKAYEPPEIDTARVYSQLLKLFSLGLFYMPIMPMGALIVCFGFFAYYWALKYHLLRHCQRPYRQSPILGYVAVRCIFVFTAAYAFSQWFFLSHSLVDQGETWVLTVMLVLLIASLVMLFMPRQVYQYLFCTCLCFPRGDDEVDGEIDYYDVQKAWAKHQKYHTTNQVYLFMEMVYFAKKRKFKDKYTPPWDFKTGNLPKPGVAPEPEAPAGPGTVGPKPGTLSIRPGKPGAADAAAAAAAAAEPISPTLPDVDVGEIMDDEDEAPAETAALAGADPAELALEEMKYKLPLATLGIKPMPVDGGDSDSEAAVSEDGSDADEEAPSPAAPLKPSAASLRPSSLRPGMTATISGLESEAGAKYNGTTCTLISQDSASAKWRVELEDGQKADLPASKLTPATPEITPGTVVPLHGLTDADQYNGTEATVIGWDSKKKGYNVKLFNGVTAFVRTWNIDWSEWPDV